MQVKNLRFGVIGWGYGGPKISPNLDTLPRATVAMIADADINRLSSLKVNQPWVKNTTQASDILLQMLTRW